MEVNRGLKSAIDDFVAHAYTKDDSWWPWPSEKLDPLLDKLTATGMLSRGDAHSLVTDQLFPHALFLLDDVPPIGDVRRAAWNVDKADQFVSFLRSLPRKYVFEFVLPGMGFEREFAVDLGPGIVFSGTVMTEEAVATNLFFKAGQRVAQLRFLEHGYSQEAPTSPMAQGVLGKLKQCIFLLNQHEVFRSMMVVRALHGASVGTMLDELANRTSMFELPPDLARFIELVAFSDDFFQTGHGYPTNQQITKAGSCNAFFRNSKTPDYVRLAAAMEWWADSRMNRDQTVAYLTACIGIESLFGEEGSELNTARLADRYAYLFGNGRTERRELHEQFLSAFRIRGDVIHARKPRLSVEDSTRLHEVQRILQRSIAKELASLTR